jgi:hypothetical protein
MLHPTTQSLLPIYGVFSDLIVSGFRHIMLSRSWHMVSHYLIKTISTSCRESSEGGDEACPRRCKSEYAQGVPFVQLVPPVIVWTLPPVGCGVNEGTEAERSPLIKSWTASSRESTREDI